MSASAASARRRLGALHPTHFECECPEERQRSRRFAPPKSVICRTERHQEGPLDADGQRERRALVDERGDVGASDVIRREIRRMGRRDPAQRDEHHKANEQSSEHHIHNDRRRRNEPAGSPSTAAASHRRARLLGEARATRHSAMPETHRKAWAPRGRRADSASRPLSAVARSLQSLLTGVRPAPAT